MAYEHFMEIAFGAFLGAGLTYLHTYFQMRENREQERKAKLTALLAEMKDNKVAIDSGIKLAQATQRLSFGMWEEARGEIFSLPAQLREKLRQAYHKVGQYDSTLEYDLALVTNKGLNQGTFDSALNKMSGEIKELLGASIAELEKYLEKTDRMT
jgi:hypothetical protein